MGQNNRQRRRKKQQKQERRARSTTSQLHRLRSTDDPRFLAEAFALLAESIAAGVQVDDGAILSALAKAWGTGGASAACAALRAAVTGAWAHGWQPADLIHAFGRKLARADRRLLVAVVLIEEATWRAHPHADPDWLAQLDELAGDGLATPSDTGADVVPAWAAAERLDRVDALLRSATLLAALWQMPILPPVGDPPSAWGQSPARRMRSSSGGTDDRMLARVRGLLAKAESTEFAPEAEALTAKAQELAARHAIDHALLFTSGGGSGGREEVTSRRVLIHDPYAKGKSHLLAQVADANRCQAVWAQDLGLSTVFGFPTDLAVTELLFTSLVSQCSTAMQAASRHVANPRSFRESFVLSFAVHIGRRLADATAATVDEARAAHGDGLLPVLASRVEQVDAARDEAFPHLRRSRLRVTDHRGWTAGQVAAELASIEVGKAVGQ